MTRASTLRTLAAAGLIALGLGAAGCNEDEVDPCAEVDAGWLTYITRRDGQYDVRIARADGTCDAPLVSGPGPDLYPSISLAKRLVVTWTTDDQGVGKLAVRKLGSQAAPVLLDLGELVAEDPEVSPDGTLVAFRGRTPPAPFGDVYVVPATGGTPAPVAPGDADESTPTWSADGQTLFFTSTRSGKPEIWRVGLAAGSEPVQVSTDDTAALTCGAAACGVQGKAAASPDGQHVAFTRATPGQQGTVIVRDLETGVERVLAPDAACAEPTWSASGRELAMFDLGWGDPEIVVRDAGTGALLHRVTRTPGIDGAPSFAR